MSEMREAFERWFLESRKSKGASRRPTFERMEDGTYADDHTQRHWWTWQNAQAARITELESRVHTCGPTCSKAGCINRRVTAERDQLRAEVQHHIVTRERLLLTLTSIHALMYPPPIKTPDGRTMVFRPNDPDPHTILQALSDRIRDIPDTIDRAIEAAKEAK